MLTCVQSIFEKNVFRCFLTAKFQKLKTRWWQFIETFGRLLLKQMLKLSRETVPLKFKVECECTESSLM